MLEYEYPLRHRRRCPSGYSYSSKCDDHGFDSPLGFDVGRGTCSVTRVGFKSLPLDENTRNHSDIEVDIRVVTRILAIWYVYRPDSELQGDT